MGKSDIIISHISEEYKHYSPSKCPWHHDRYCLLLLNNFNHSRFHCLFASRSIQWKSYSITGSCDIPEQFNDVKMLSDELGKNYVLPFYYAFRERSGYTIGLFQLNIGLYGCNMIKSENLSEMYYAMIVLMCAVCRRMGGNPPIFKNMTFVYTETHPVLADVGADNSEKRFRVGNRESLNKKKWYRFFRNRTSREILRYFRLVRPDLFKKKCNNQTNCVLASSINFDDETHDLICKSKKLSVLEILENYIHLMVDENIKSIILEWIRECKSSEINNH